MSNVWFTSDNHFFHKNICKGESNWVDKETACRDFKTIKEHDDYLINITNKHVRSSDILYDLGDFGGMRASRQDLIDIRRRINCEKIYLIRGNHDTLFTDRNRNKYPELFAMFHKVCDLYSKKIHGRFFVLCHYALLTWQRQHREAIMLHGHSHSNLVYPFKGRIHDVGRDTKLYGHEKYAPYSVEEIFHIIDNFKNDFTSLDHHQPNNNDR